MKIPNLFSALPTDRSQEVFETLVQGAAFRLERIVSFGQATPPGTWLKQAREEWVMLLKGKAGLLFEGDAEVRVLEPGDQLRIPAHRRHRVAWTETGKETIWVALHYDQK